MNKSSAILKSKSKKSLKDREKRKSQTSSDSSLQNIEKVLPAKESLSVRQYAGIGPESIGIYAEQSCCEQLSEELCSKLAEDVNYKLRHIIYDALIRARISERNVISSSDIEASFSTLNIDKVYGAPTTPSWVPFGDQGLSYLDDETVDLVKLAEDEFTYSQPGDVIMTKTWLPDNCSESLRFYFVTMSKAVVGKDANAAQMALRNISTNIKIGAAIEWFYHFIYFLLSKDITYDCLTMKALALLVAVEENPLSPMSVSERQLKFLVHILLQRLLKVSTTYDVKNNICRVLGILCKNRTPLRDFVINKLRHKLTTANTYSILTTIHALGFEAIESLFVPNINYFFDIISQTTYSNIETSAIMAIYNTICKTENHSELIQKTYTEFFGSTIHIYWRYPHNIPKNEIKEESNWLYVKSKLMKTRRKIEPSPLKREKRIIDLKEVFPESKNIVLKRAQIRFRYKSFSSVKEWHGRRKTTNKQRLTETASLTVANEINITIGKNSLLIPVMRKFQKKMYHKKCCDHTLRYFNL